MLLKHLHKFLTAPVIKISSPRAIFWFSLSLTVAAIFGFLGLQLAFGSEYVVQDDARITATEARALPEFLEQGRTRFFLDSSFEFWLYADRSGILPVEWWHLPYKYFLAMFAVGLLLPLLLQYPSRFPIVRQVAKGVRPLPQLLLTSVSMFFAAHALLFKLYLPSRYTTYSLRILMALLAAMTLTVILDGVFHACLQQPNLSFGKQFLALGSTVILAAALVLYPSYLHLSGKWKSLFINAFYIPGGVPPLYEFFQQQTKDSLIASLSEETSKLPAFTQRSVLVGKENAIPYHVGYYSQFRQRLADLIRAQYSQDLAESKNLIQRYRVNLLLLDRTAFTPEYIANNLLLIQFLQPAAKNKNDRLVEITTEALANLKRGNIPALATVMNRCSIFEVNGSVVLQAECILNTSTK